MRLRVATGNAGKLREFAAVLEPLGISVEGPASPFAVDEDGLTFAANALKKAQTLSRAWGGPAVADDSGLEVDSLQGAPGVHSARYAGETGPGADAANRKKLLEALGDRPQIERTARFVCVICYCVPGDEPLYFSGIVSGHIAASPRGTGGFGYDSLFVPVGESRTFAEIPLAEKNAVSHRGHALRALAAHLKGHASK